MLKYLLGGVKKGEEIPLEMFGKLLASDGAASDYFGRAVSISGNGNVALVGSYQDDDKGSGSGSAYIFTKQANGSYMQTSKLVAIDGADSDQFGWSVSISGNGNVALVGANGDDDKGTNSGSAYIFTKQANGDYLQTQKLVASDGTDNDQFGRSVSISSDGNVVLVGAYNDGDKGAGSGSVYIFTKLSTNGSYMLTGKLVASDGAASDRFGYSVSISGDGNVALIGAYWDDDKGTNSGSAYIFTKQTNGSYTQTRKLVTGDGAENDQFGWSVSISGNGNVALIGAIYDDDKGANSGSAYIFTKQANGAYLQTQKLVASDGAENDQFGWSVSISGDGNVALVGAYLDDDNGSSSGSVHIFTKQADGAYLQTQKLVASDGAENDRFGYSVSISGDGNVALVGADQDDDKGTESGSAYIFK